MDVKYLTDLTQTLDAELEAAVREEAEARTRRLRLEGAVSLARQLLHEERVQSDPAAATVNNREDGHA